MVFLDDGTLLITSGDGFNYREKAQYLDNHFGKIITVTPQGVGVGIALKPTGLFAMADTNNKRHHDNNGGEV